MISMKQNSVTEQLVGSEIHGFHTLHELDVGSTMEEARGRWLHPNEIHVILCNYKCFSILVKPVHLPKSGTIVLFDRKILRNFRKDGHNWKKKNDGKTVKEAHDRLKVGNEERIHEYYARGQDNPSFVRRCYWLLDKSLEHIVLVHYRETQEKQGAPVTPVNSSSSSVSHLIAPWIISEEKDSRTNYAFVGEPNENLSHELRLHEINTREWDDLVVTNDLDDSTVPNEGKVLCFDQQNQTLLDGSLSNVAKDPSGVIPSFHDLTKPIAGNNGAPYSFSETVNLQTMNNQVNPKVESGLPITVGGVDSIDTLVNDGLESQDSLGRWMNNFMCNSPCTVDNSALGSSVSSVHEPYSSLVADHHQPSLPEQIFNVTDVSPEWASSTEKTKILITGFFHDDYLHLAKSNLLCVCGDVSVPAEIVQVGVYRCWVSPHSPGFVILYLSLDGQKPISQVLNFEYRENLPEDQLYLKETLAAYRSAAEAAACIQVAFREQSLKLQTKAIEFLSPEAEARAIVAALKIQHAFRNFETRKMAAAARIKHTYCTWKFRKEFLCKRRQAIKIQAIFRGFQARKQYRKIIWSVGVLEKAILRWRLKKKGFRGLRVDPVQEV